MDYTRSGDKENYLWGFYYHTSFPSSIGTLALPWVAFIGTLVLSLLTVHLLLKTWMRRVM